jgi:hypothetical protein
MIGMDTWEADIVCDFFIHKSTNARCRSCGATASALGTGERATERCVAQLQLNCSCTLDREHPPGSVEPPGLAEIALEAEDKPL